MSVVDLASGARIEYHDIGSGAPVVYFNGDGGVIQDAAFIPALAKRYRVLAPSRPRVDGSTAQQEAEVMVEFIRSTVGGPVHLIAESAGGAAGCWLAVLEPSLIESLVLVAPTALANGSRTELVERLGEISVPTLVLWGTADEVIPPESGQVYLRRIPNSYRILIYGASHSLPVVACQKFVELVTDFIERGDRFVVAEPT